MKFENEITVEIDTTLDKLIRILEDNNFKLVEEYDLNDIYMINSNDKSEKDYGTLLNKCVLLRHLIEKDKDTKMITYKYKEYNEQKEITKQGKIKCNISDIENAKLIFEKLNFEVLIEIYDHTLVFFNGEDELVVQNVNNKHIYIEIEDKGYHSNKIYNSIDDMKCVFKKYGIPVKNNNYFAKKAEVELSEK